MFSYYDYSISYCYSKLFRDRILNCGNLVSAAGHSRLVTVRPGVCVTTFVIFCSMEFRFGGSFPEKHAKFFGDWVEEHPEYALYSPGRDTLVLLKYNLYEY